MQPRFTFVIGAKTSGKREVLDVLHVMRATTASEHTLMNETGVLLSPLNSLLPYSVNVMFNDLHPEIVKRSSIIISDNKVIRKEAKIIFVFSVSGDIDEQIKYLIAQKIQIEKKYLLLKLNPPVFILIVITPVFSARGERGRSFSIDKRTKLSATHANVIKQLEKDLTILPGKTIVDANFSDMSSFVTSIRNVVRRSAFQLQEISCSRTEKSAYLMGDESPEDDSPKEASLLSIKEASLLSIDPSAPVIPREFNTEKKLVDLKAEHFQVKPFSSVIENIVFHAAGDEKEEKLKGHLLDLVESLQRKTLSMRKWNDTKHGEIAEAFAIYLDSLFEGDPWWALLIFRDKISKITKTCMPSSKVFISVAGLTLGGLAGAALAGPAAPALALGGKIAACALFGATSARGVAAFDDDGTQQLIFDIADAAFEFAMCDPERRKKASKDEDVLERRIEKKTS